MLLQNSMDFRKKNTLYDFFHKINSMRQHKRREKERKNIYQPSLIKNQGWCGKNHTGNTGGFYRFLPPNKPQKWEILGNSILIIRFFKFCRILIHHFKLNELKTVHLSYFDSLFLPSKHSIIYLPMI
jgi:hypothetical protein